MSYLDRLRSNVTAQRDKSDRSDKSPAFTTSHTATKATEATEAPLLSHKSLLSQGAEREADTPDHTVICSDCGTVDIIAAYDPRLQPLCYECAREIMPAEVFKPRKRRS